METKIKAEVIRDKSFDPHFWIKVSYDDGKNKFIDEMVSVERKPPRVKIEYSESIIKMIDKIDVKKIELEIMKTIVENLLRSR
ncbi:MAG: hypothetical protein GX625_09685 [Clostridiaceae bacterium]|nr:hypothetical protein [Clostridiaceae bacterium]